MPVKRLAALGLLFSLATCCIVLACRTKHPTATTTVAAYLLDASADACVDGATAVVMSPDGPIACTVDVPALSTAMRAVGGTGTGLAQDATVQQILKLYGASIPQGGTGTGLCQDATLQVLYTLIQAQLGSNQLDGNVIGPSNANVVVEIQNVPVSDAAPVTGQYFVFNGTAWVPAFPPEAGLTAYAQITTGDAAVSQIYIEPAENASTGYDYVFSVVGFAVTGDMLRVDYAFNTQRVGSASPTFVGLPEAGIVQLNVRTSLEGGTWGGVTFAFVGNSLTERVQGPATNTVNWTTAVDRIEAP